MKKSFTMLLIVVFAHITAFAQTEKHLALVVGNSEYVDKANLLKNPVNDAKDMSNQNKIRGVDGHVQPLRLALLE